MELEVGGSKIKLKKGDITEEKVDAIVNAANTSLLGGGGVDGAIHRAGGPEILEQCRKLGGARPGNAKITTGGKLPAEHVIHAVGPIYKDGDQGEAETLQSAYRSSLEVAVENRVKTLAFPSISTGAYSFPIKDASRIALSTIKQFLENDDAIESVTMVLFSDGDLKAYEKALKDLSE